MKTYLFCKFVLKDHPVQGPLWFSMYLFIEELWKTWEDPSIDSIDDDKRNERTLLCLHVLFAVLKLGASSVRKGKWWPVWNSNLWDERPMLVTVELRDTMADGAFARLSFIFGRGRHLMVALWPQVPYENANTCGVCWLWKHHRKTAYFPTQDEFFLLFGRVPSTRYVLPGISWNSSFYHQ